MTRLLVLVWVAALLYALFLTAKLVTRRARLTDRPFLIRWMVAWAAMLALSDLGKRHWFTALRMAFLVSNVVFSTVTGDTSNARTSAFQRFFRHLNIITTCLHIKKAIIVSTTHH